jgi:hypothetical protein
MNELSLAPSQVSAMKLALNDDGHFIQPASLKNRAEKSRYDS